MKTLNSKEIILPSVVVDDTSAKDRLLALERLPPKSLDLTVIKRSIRQDCLGDWIDKAASVWNAGAYDSAYLYFWNRALADLRAKLVAYGLEHVEAIVGKSIKDERDLVNLLDDKALLDTCFELGIISEQAWFFLDKCREIRNHYSLAHQFDAQIDTIEAVNIIKNCIKYVLAHQVPSPGINLKKVIERLKSEDISKRLAEVEATYKEQATKIVNITLNRLFDDFIEEKTNNVYLNNIHLLAPILWKLTDDSVKVRIGKQVARIRVESDPVKNKRAMIFLTTVGGMKFVPESIRAAIFASAADALTETCQQANNFFLEGSPARELQSLGPDIPSSAVASYVKATTLSFIGNTWGYSWSASDHDKQMIGFWTSSCVDSFLAQIESDLILLRRLASENPAKRFLELIKILEGKEVDAKAQAQLQKLSKMTPEQLTKHFSEVIFDRFFQTSGSANST